MFNREIPRPLNTHEGDVPLAANDNEQFDAGDQELLTRTHEELGKIDLTLEGEVLRSAFQFRMQALANENAQANRHLIEELARAHKIIEADRVAAKNRALFAVAARTVDSINN